MNKPIRLDIYLTTHHNIQSRNKANELIKNKKIKIDGVIITKPSFKIEESMEIKILQEQFYVSRSAYKLKYFLDEIDISLQNKNAIDIGSSTGGFTQILLENNIKNITCIDVGSNQLHKTIKDDDRLNIFENTDIRKFIPNKRFDIVTCDVSFISILNILEDIDRLANQDIIILYKPQYEVGINIKRDRAGVVQDKLAIKEKREIFIAETSKLGWNLIYSSLSKITGKEGNIEELFYFHKQNKEIKKDTITSIAIGGFDGMHLAHQELFNRLDDNGAIVVIETGYASLTPKVNRANYTSYPLYYYPLDNIKHLTAKEFISLLIQEYPDLKQIVVGFDFKFGTKASYGISDLKELFKGDVTVVDEFLYKDIAVHSRIIRDFISQGAIQKANEFLDKRYSIVGNHIKGQGIGAKQFVATINIKCDNFLIPEIGIYASYTILHNIKYLSVTFIGHRLSTDGKYAIETHIIDKEIEDINSNIKVEFIKKIRDNKKFNDLEELKQQILTDIQITKKLLLKDNDVE